MVIGGPGFDRVHIESAKILINLIADLLQGFIAGLIGDFLRVGGDGAVLSVHHGNVLQDQPVQQLAAVVGCHAKGPGDEPVNLSAVLDIIGKAGKHHVVGINEGLEIVQRTLPVFPGVEREDRQHGQIVGSGDLLPVCLGNLNRLHVWLQLRDRLQSRNAVLALRGLVADVSLLSVQDGIDGPLAPVEAPEPDTSPKSPRALIIEGKKLRLFEEIVFHTLAVKARMNIEIRRAVALRPVGPLVDHLIEVVSKGFLGGIDGDGGSVLLGLLRLSRETDAVSERITAAIRNQPMNQPVPDLGVSLGEVVLRDASHAVDNALGVEDGNVSSCHILLFLLSLAVLIGGSVAGDGIAHPFGLIFCLFIILPGNHLLLLSSASSASSVSGDGSMHFFHGSKRDFLRFVSC